MPVNTERKLLPSIHQSKIFVDAYPIKKKFDCHIGLDKFVKEYGTPYKMAYDSAQEQIVRKTEFQRMMRKYEIKGHVTEKNGQTKMQYKVHTRTTT